jgi:hypothetical protein
LDRNTFKKSDRGGSGVGVGMGMNPWMVEIGMSGSESVQENERGETIQEVRRLSPEIMIVTVPPERDGNIARCTG